MNIGIIGFGKMGETIAQGLVRSSGKTGSKHIQGTTRSESSAREISKRLGIHCHTSNRELVETSDIIILCTKPHQAQDVLTSVRSKMKSGKLLLSICASITTEQLCIWSGKKAGIIRAMPNTPCLIGEGMTVFCAGPNATDQHLATAEQIFMNLGKTTILEESLMDGATGLSGCGPAYVYLIIEALSEAGVKIGLSRKTATLLAAQTLAGASRMVLSRDAHPAALKDEVTTPAGCTIDGLMALEEGKLRVTLIKAVLAATQRSKSLRSQK